MATINYEPKYNTFYCEHSVQYDDESSIEFKIACFAKDTEEFNSEELEKTVNAFFSNKRKLSINDILKSIRTIFREHKEYYLNVHTSNGITTERVEVNYEGEKLVRYEEKRVINGEDVFIKINSSQCQIDWKRSGLDLNYIKPISNIASTLESISQIKPYKIDEEDRILCTLYEQFYDKLPDFRNSDDVVKAQFFMFYLFLFDLCFFEEQRFDKGKENYPIDPGIYTQTSKLMLFGDLGNNISRVKYNARTNQTIERAKNAFFTAALEEGIDINNVENLKHIAAIAFTDKYAFMEREEEPEAYAVATALGSEEVAQILSLYKKVNKARK